MIDFIHPDYLPDEQPIVELIEDGKLLNTAVNDLIMDVKHSEHMFNTNGQWLGTFEINGQRCQLQLVMTNIDSHFVDEG